MEDYPRTLADFEERFRSEEACRDYLFRVRWPEGFRCPRCGESRGWRLRSALWQARQCCAYGWLVGLPPDSKGYRRQITVLRGQRHPSELLPRVHRVISLLKRWLLGTHQGAVRLEHVDDYLNEFTFRFNRRRSRSRGKLFFRLVQQAMAVEPSTYTSIVRAAKTGRV